MPSNCYWFCCCCCCQLLFFFALWISALLLLLLYLCPGMPASQSVTQFGNQFRFFLRFGFGSWISIYSCRFRVPQCPRLGGSVRERDGGRKSSHNHVFIHSYDVHLDVSIKLEQTKRWARYVYAAWRTATRAALRPKPNGYQQQQQQKQHQHTRELSTKRRQNKNKNAFLIVRLQTVNIVRETERANGGGRTPETS